MGVPAISVAGGLGQVPTQAQGGCGGVAPSPTSSSSSFGKCQIELESDWFCAEPIFAWRGKNNNNN